VNRPKVGQYGKLTEKDSRSGAETRDGAVEIGRDKKAVGTMLTRTGRCCRNWSVDQCSSGMANGTVANDDMCERRSGDAGTEIRESESDHGVVYPGAAGVWRRGLLPGMARGNNSGTIWP